MHCVSEVHPTQVPELHTGVGLLQSVFVEHMGAPAPCHSQSGPPEPALL